MATSDRTFSPWPKVARLNRDVIVTEKIDGTNAAVVVSEDGSDVYAQSRTRIVTPGDDNFGFGAWVEAHRDELAALGPGYHFGEWWGRGIQRNYSQTARRFSLFNVTRWGWADPPPACCGIVPVLYAGSFHTERIKATLRDLEKNGSAAAPGFMQPEGIIVFHTASHALFKQTIGDDGAKGAA